VIVLTVVFVAVTQSYKNSLQNYIQGKGLKLPEYKAMPQLSGNVVLDSRLFVEFEYFPWIVYSLMSTAT